MMGSRGKIVTTPHGSEPIVRQKAIATRPPPGDTVIEARRRVTCTGCQSSERRQPPSRAIAPPVSPPITVPPEARSAKGGYGSSSSPQTDFPQPPCVIDAPTSQPNPAPTPVITTVLRMRCRLRRIPALTWSCDSCERLTSIVSCPDLLFTSMVSPVTDTSVPDQGCSRGSLIRTCAPGVMRVLVWSPRASRGADWAPPRADTVPRRSMATMGRASLLDMIMLRERYGGGGAPDVSIDRHVRCSPAHCCANSARLGPPDSGMPRWYVLFSACAAASASTRWPSAVGWRPSRLTYGPYGCVVPMMAAALSGPFVTVLSYRV